MEAFNKIAESLTADGPDRVLPGVAMIAANSNGDTLYSKSFGFTAAGPVDADTPMWVASCSKLIISIALMQCVDKGLIDLEESVDRVLPELSDPDVLDGFDEETGEPIIRKANKKITFVHLLTHTAGLAYDNWNPTLLKWRKVTKTDPVTTVVKIEHLVYPLLFDPGEGWVYGAGLDWVGKAIERVNGGIELEEYLKKNIFEPLGMQHTTLRPSQDNHILENKAEPTSRTPTGELVATPAESQPPIKPADEYGGHGVWSTPSEYMTFLISVLKNDGKLLSPATLSKIFEPRLSDNSHLIRFMHSSGSEMAMTNAIPGNETWNHSLAGVLTTEDMPNRRLKGSINWHGLHNSYWWIDPKRGTCGLSATQLAGYVDPHSLSLFSKFEAMIFQEFGPQPA
ncbi:hypothetical protein AJ78_07701 [Emergomyces pasteurianus Ep9510]|uniref:Beta-lactamase-related domain-containing protein n=1 Tax=Emergomyces pasteurianus Ep9510 TaxID=1447872 RepID=A0A1J9Q6K1_9EURO|nr:hypothetical protein AJ78_07701 [Emergomyces pasteurianus Ep9510]